jgi:hypothetical protein
VRQGFGTAGGVLIWFLGLAMVAACLLSGFVAFLEEREIGAQTDLYACNRTVHNTVVRNTPFAKGVPIVNFPVTINSHPAFPQSLDLFITQWLRKPERLNLDDGWTKNRPEQICWTRHCGQQRFERKLSYRDRSPVHEIVGGCLASIFDGYLRGWTGVRGQ